MIPLIFVTDNKKKVIDYLSKYLNIDYFFFEITPKKEKFSIDDIREVKKEIFIFNNKIRVYFFDNFQNSSLEAQNSFLKILEEAPVNILFVLTVDNENKLLPTILSRAKIIKFLSKKNQLTDEKRKILNDFFKKNYLDLKIIEDINIDDLILFLRENLNKKNYNLILKDALEIKSLNEKNNLNIRLALDHLFIRLFLEGKVIDNDFNN